MPSFDKYAPYIWSAYGIVMAGLLITVLAVLCAYRRARLNDIADERTDDR
ncbi:MAG TPA: heme exporter protein CcmD [Alphaproteobacteria bacterium]